jgi:hypothetical protein
VPPAQSLDTCLTRAHEIGHVIGEPEPEGSPSKLGESGRTRICVAGELRAWRWVLDHIPVWNHTLSHLMSVSIETYRQHATEAEQAEIDALISPRQFRETRVRVLGL